MTRTLATILLASVALSGCASMPDSVRGPFAHSGRTASDASVQQPDVSPFPQGTDGGKF